MTPVASESTLMLMWPIFAAGILLFDLFLRAYNDEEPWHGLTISRAVIRAKPWEQILLVTGMAALILHLWTDFLF